MEETWKPIKEYEGYYEVSNWGRIRRIKSGSGTKKGKILTQRKNKGGYLFVDLYKENVRKRFLSHRLVAYSFLERKKRIELEINHKDGNKQNNFPENLEWITRSENAKHAFIFGLKNQIGENNNFSKLSNAEVLEIKKLLKLKTKQCDIAKKFNVSSSTICDIKYERTRKNDIRRT